MSEHRGRGRGASISLGDWLEAVKRLSPHDAAAREAIFAALGFEPVRTTVPDLCVGPRLDHDSVVEPVVLPPPSVPPPLSLPPEELSAPKIAGGAAAVTDAGTTTFAAPDWALEPADPFLAADGRADSLPPPPLFPAAGTRAILGAVLAMWCEGNQLDVDRVVALLVRGRPLRRLPLLSAPTLRRGAQVLVDRSDAMAPFQSDIDGLLADIERLFPRRHARVLNFKHCPGRGVREGASRRRAWEPPGRGMPVLVVSDFGVGTPLEDEDFAGVDEWLVFARLVAEVGCSAVAVTPFPPRRWPALLTRAMTFVHWSERTTARQAARALRELGRFRARANE